MRFRDTYEMAKLREEVDPYLIINGIDISYKEGTPREIIEKHEKLKQMVRDYKKEEIFG